MKDFSETSLLLTIVKFCCVVSEMCVREGGKA